MTSIKPAKLNILLLALIFFSTSRALATLPPPFVELTSAEMKSRQFKFDIQRSDAQSAIELHFPKQVFADGFWLVPRSTYVIFKNKAGQDIARTINYVSGSKARSIMASYDHRISDMYVSITYECENAVGCHGSATFGISSISRFIDANPDADGLQEKCHKFTGQTVEIVNCKTLKK